MSSTSSSTPPTSAPDSPDPINNLRSSSPHSNTEPPTTTMPQPLDIQQQDHHPESQSAQRNVASSPVASEWRGPSAAGPGPSGQVKLEKPLVLARAGEGRHQDGAQVVGTEEEEAEVEHAVRSEGEGDVAGQHEEEGVGSDQLKVDWGQERLEDEIRPLDTHTAFVNRLAEYQDQESDVIKSYMREMVATLLESEVWAITYLRSLADSHVRALKEATARIEDEEVFQEETRKGLLLVKEQVQDAMARLESMQSLALVRVRARSEVADDGEAAGNARKKARKT